jgi:DNA-binding transcriptional LysR family regulator
MLEELLKHAETTKSTAREFLRAEKKPVRLGIMSSLGPMRIAPFLTRFAARHPEIEITLVEGDAKRLEELLLRGTIEVALVGPIGVAGERVRISRLYREPVVVVFPHGHRFEVQPAVRMVDLRDESFILRTQCEKRELVLDSCRQRGFEPRIVYRGEREDWVQMMVAAGCGITLMPENLHFRHGTVARPLIDPALDRQVSLATVAGRMQDDHVQRLVRAIQAHDWNATSAAADRSLSSGRAQRPMIAWEAPDD